MNLTLNLKEHFKNIPIIDCFMDLLVVMSVVKAFFPQFTEKVNSIIPLILFISIFFRGILSFLKTKKKKEEEEKKNKQENLKEVQNDLKSLIDDFKKLIIANNENEVLRKINLEPTIDYGYHLLEINVNRKKKIISFIIKDKKENITIIERNINYKNFK